MRNNPKPNTQFLSWFVSEQKKNTLQLTPKYQRNPIWSSGQKCFLIDSLLSGCPIPQIYLNIVDQGSGINRKTFYEVVDGQQRLRTILEFISDEFNLIPIKKSYPVSDEYAHHIGKCYSELPKDVQDNIWNYPISVQELRGWSDHEIRALFRRLNYVVERLNAQEMRHSQYFGEFSNAVEKLAEAPFFDEVPLFTRRDSQRMKDVEFVCEIFILLINGPQDQQKTIDDFYATYDVEFPKKGKYLRQFRAALSTLYEIRDFLCESRFLQKADFYGLVGAINQLSNSGINEIDLRKAIPALTILDKELKKEPQNLSEKYRSYHSTVIEGPNKLNKRNQRISFLVDLIQKSVSEK